MIALKGIGNPRLNFSSHPPPVNLRTLFFKLACWSPDSEDRKIIGRLIIKRPQRAYNVIRHMLPNKWSNGLDRGALMDAIINRIRECLNGRSDGATKQSFQRFFKEPVKCYGVKSNAVGSISKAFFKEVEPRSKGAIFELCEELFSSGYCEEAFIAANWLFKIAKRFERDDIEVFREWITLYISNWATCDTLCNHAVGALIVSYPDCFSELKDWARSKNRWLRRASAVSLIIPAKKGDLLGEVIEICDILISDQDDMVQKGYGWLLKEASRVHQREIFDYVIRNRDRMPRTALRYAIELMPRELRAEAMRRA